MLSFFNKRRTLIDADLFEGFVDYHSHILPCVDDGMQRVEEALSTLAWYEELGVKSVSFTPHIMEDYPRNNATSLTELFSKFKSQYSGGVDIHLGSEYMLDPKFNSHLCSPAPLTIGKGRHLLVEMSFAHAPITLKSMIQEVMSKGYFVVLAHPERYLYLNSRDYASLKSMGVLFQLNLLSPLGGYGSGVKQRAEELLLSSMYDIMGSDIHSLTHHQETLQSIKLPSKIVSKLLDLRDIELG